MTQQPLVTELTTFEWLCAAAAVGAAATGVVSGQEKFLLIPVFCAVWHLSSRVPVKVVPEEQVREGFRRWKLTRLSEARIERAIKMMNAGPAAGRLISHCGLALTAFGGLAAAIMEL